MRLTQIFALEALRNLVYNWNEKEIKQNVQDHVTPVAVLRTGGCNTQENNDKHTNDDGCITDGIVEPDFTSVTSHHDSAEIESVLESLESDFVFWKIRTVESSSWVG